MSEMHPMGSDRIKLHSDEWRDLNESYKVLSYYRRDPNSTAVELELETYSGDIQKRVVPHHWIEWVFGEE